MKPPATVYVVTDETLTPEGEVVETEVLGPFTKPGPAKAARTRAARAVNFLGRRHRVTAHEGTVTWKELA